MNSFTLIFGLALIAVAAAHGGSSYVKRTDNHGHHTEVSHGHHGDEGHGHQEASGHGHGHGGHDESHDYYHHPSYKFEYGVKDPKTKDHHSQWEHRDGDVVKGEYFLDEADGTKRVVKYSSDKKSGFTAQVERIGHADHPHGHHEHHWDLWLKETFLNRNNRKNKSQFAISNKLFLIIRYRKKLQRQN